MELALSATEGSFSEVLGLRLGVRTFLENTQWHGSWEVARLVETTSIGDRESLWQHDLRFGFQRQVWGGWNASVHLEVGLGEDQDHRTLGFFLARRF